MEQFKLDEQNEIDLYTWFQAEMALKSLFRKKLTSLPPWAKKRGYQDLASLKKTYRERLSYEYSIIRSMGFCGYFLIVADGIEYCRREKIPAGPGRGDRDRLEYLTR